MHALIVMVLGWIASLVVLRIIVGIFGVLTNLLAYVLAIIASPFSKLGIEGSMKMASASMLSGIAAGLFAYFLFPVVGDAQYLVADTSAFITGKIYGLTGQVFVVVEQFLFYLNWGNLIIILSVIFTIVLHIFRTALESRTREARKRRLDTERRNNELAQEQKIEQGRVAEEAAREREIEERQQAHLALEEACKTAPVEELAQMAGLQIAEYQDIYHLVKAKDDRVQVVGKFFHAETLREEIVRILKR
jgi:hypothetical protein